LKLITTITVDRCSGAAVNTAKFTVSSDL